jgi:hypothetical protein
MRRPNPFANAIDIVIAPNAAFERIREVPTWVWAFVVASILGAIGSVLLTPALIHAADLTMPANLAASPDIAKLPPDQQQSMIALRMKFSHVILQLTWLFVPLGLLLVGLLQALVMLLGNAIGRGDGTFRKYFALSLTVSVVGTGLGTLVTGLIVMLRGASSFESQSAVTGSMPGLGLLVPGAHGALAGFLAVFTVFSLWSVALVALGMVRVGRVSPPIAWTLAILMLLIGASFSAFGASFNG